MPWGRAFTGRISAFAGRAIILTETLFRIVEVRFKFDRTFEGDKHEESDNR
jgi:hypothetical protein